jgi:hypothetical protein
LGGVLIKPSVEAHRECPLYPQSRTWGERARYVPQADIAIDLLALGVGNGRDPFAIPLDHNDLLYAQRAMLI